MVRKATTALTDNRIKNAKATGSMYRLRDGYEPGLTLTISPKGAKSWALWFTSPETGKRRSYGLGSYPVVKLKDARRKAGKLREKIDQKIDPVEEEGRREAVRVAQKAGTFGALLNLYLDKLRAEDKDRFADKVEIDIERNISTEIQELPADEVKDDHVILLMNRVTARARKRNRTGERSADYVRTYVSAAFEFALSARASKWKEQAAPFVHLKYNPARQIKKFQEGPSVGHRSLSRSELVQLWNSIGVDALSKDMALYVKLAFTLGGQRVEELLLARWNEFDTDTRSWAIPIERRKIRSKAKHREPHLVYLTDQAIELLEELQELTGHTPYLFPDRTDDQPRTSCALNQAIHRYCVPGPKSKRQGFELFTPRDLRRTAKTLMGEAGLSKEIRDRIQGHAFGDVGSVHYDRYDYWKEKQAAMKQWERWLLAQFRKSINNNVIAIESGRRM